MVSTHTGERNEGCCLFPLLYGVCYSLADMAVTDFNSERRIGLYKRFLHTKNGTRAI